MLETFTLEMFTPLVGTEFRVVGEAAIVLTLEEATPSGRVTGDTSTRPEVRKAFSLIFLGPQTPLLGQGTCTLQHPALGELSIFMVPIAQDSDGLHYQAIFT